MKGNLADVGYLADDGLATIAYLAYSLGRPLFLEGDPGVGKTELARALSSITHTKLRRLQCYEGIDRRQALYEWDFPRQILHLRVAGSNEDPTALEDSLYDKRYLIKRPILRALKGSATLLIDEIDRADDEFEAFLLEVLSDFAVSIPELGRIRAKEGARPLVVITSNQTREVHDALKRRCFYHYVDHPELEREIEIVRHRVPGAAEGLVKDAAKIVARLREAKLLKPPGVAETIDWVEALHLLGRRDLQADVTPETLNTLGTLLKCHDDITTVSKNGLLGAA